MLEEAWGARKVVDKIMAEVIRTLALKSRKNTHISVLVKKIIFFYIFLLLGPKYEGPEKKPSFLGILKVGEKQCT